MISVSPHRRMMSIDGLNAVSIMYAGRLGAVAYKDKVLGYGPIAYWMLAEAAGLTAIDQVNSPAQDGTHVGVTLGQSGIGDGQTSPLYDGINDYTNIYSATLAGVFNGAAGTAIIWAKVSGAGVWTDGTYRMMLGLYATSTNYIEVLRHASNNILRWYYRAGGTHKSVLTSGHSDLDWMCLGLTWDKTADELKAWKDGSQEGATQAGLGIWAGSLNSATTVIGAQTTASVMPFDGYLAHGILFDTALTPAEILDLATV